MTRYILRQLFLLVVTLLLLGLVAFGLTYWFPGEAMTNMTGLQPGAVGFAEAAQARGEELSRWRQFPLYVQHLLQGDWGVSLIDGAPVAAELRPRLIATLEIALLAMALALLIGIPLGLLAAARVGSWVDHTIMVVSLTGYSIPVFWFAQVSVLLLGVQLGWLPIAGQINPLYDLPGHSGSILYDTLTAPADLRQAALGSALQHMLLPVLALTIMPLMLTVRISRNAILEVMHKNYIRGAYAKGLSARQVISRHLMPNTMQYIIRELSTLFNVLLTNALVVELIFSWPGLGNWLVRSIYERDYPVIIGGLLVMSTLILLVTIGLSIMRAWRYPQVRQELYAHH